MNLTTLSDIELCDLFSGRALSDELVAAIIAEVNRRKIKHSTSCQGSGRPGVSPAVSLAKAGRAAIFFTLLALGTACGGPAMQGGEPRQMWKLYDELPDGTKRIESCHRSKNECSMAKQFAGDKCALEEIAVGECGS